MENHPFDVLARPSAAALAQMNKAPVMRRNHMLPGKEASICIKTNQGNISMAKWRDETSSSSLRC